MQEYRVERPNSDYRIGESLWQEVISESRIEGQGGVGKEEGKGRHAWSSRKENSICKGSKVPQLSQNSQNTRNERKVIREGDEVIVGPVGHVESLGFIPKTVAYHWLGGTD